MRRQSGWRSRVLGLEADLRQSSQIAEFLADLEVARDDGFGS